MRQLRRQFDSQFYERTALSQTKQRSVRWKVTAPPLPPLLDLKLDLAHKAVSGSATLRLRHLLFLPEPRSPITCKMHTICVQNACFLKAATAGPLV